MIRFVLFTLFFYYIYSILSITITFPGNWQLVFSGCISYSGCYYEKLSKITICISIRILAIQCVSLLIFFRKLHALIVFFPPIYVTNSSHLLSHCLFFSSVIFLLSCVWRIFIFHWVFNLFSLQPIVVFSFLLFLHVDFNFNFCVKKIKIYLAHMLQRSEK